jgi:parallel beta-helix repeat protein
VQAVYLDDQLSGTVITNNLFDNCMTGVVLGGGRDNVVMLNTFVNNDLAVHLDNRGMNWQQSVRAALATVSAPCLFIRSLCFL